MVRMISKLNMTKFMNDNVLKNRKRSQNKKPVDINIIVNTATSPPCFLAFYGDRARKKIFVWRVLLHY